METVDIARKAVEIASEKQAEDIVLIDTKQACSFADYFVICSGCTEPHLESIRDAIDETLKHENLPVRRIQGTLKSGWLLCDYGDIIVHIFSVQQREFYRLEELWRDAQLIIKMQ